MSGFPLEFLPPQGGDTPEFDRLEGAPHPREMLSLLGHGVQEAEFLDLYNSGRLHHAFMLTGPEGIGKATFAYRVARFLFAEDDRGAGGLFGGEGASSLGVPAEARATHLVANAAHPDMAVLKRRYDPDTKKFRGEIGVADMRDALHLLEKTPAFGGWRVVIVDAADDLNNASANALLKTLEEPPEKTIFLLVSHQPQRLLPTIRSRCRKLAFAPLAREDMTRIVSGFGAATTPDDRAIDAAEGSVRQALRLADPALRAFLDAVEDILGALPKKRHAEIDRLAGMMRAGAQGEQPMADFLGALETRLHRMIRARVSAGDVDGASALAEFWARAGDDARSLEAYNLDRRAFVITLIEDLATLV